MKKVLLLVITLLIIIGIYGCVPEDAYISGADQIELENSTLFKLENYDKDDIIWSSSDNSIASVVNGMVIAKGLGEAVIYAKVGKHAFEKKITVVNPVVQIIIHGKNYLYFNEEYKFSCTLSEVLEEKVTWSSSDQDILEIDNDGNAFAKQEGSVDVTASIYGNTSTFTVVVVPPTIDITIIGKNQLVIGEEYTYTCNLSKEVDEKVTWSSSDSNIIEIDESGKVVAKNVGTCVITASIYNNTSDFFVTVNYPNIDISISGRNTLTLEEEYIYTYTLSNEVNEKVKWTSSDSSILEIDETGKAVAKNVGTCIITASVYNSESTLEVTVSYPIVDLVITGKNLLYIDEEYSYACESSTDEKVKWTSSDSSILEIDDDGNAVAKSEGNVTITASIYDSIATFNVEVIKYTFNGSLVGPDEVKVGNEIKLEKENFNDLYPYTLKVSDESIATISQDGTLKAIKRGIVTIYACSTDGEMHELKKVKILEKDFIIVIEGPNIVNKGDRFVVEATTNPEDIDTEFTYSSSDSSIISINRFGVANALKGGKATIYVSSVYDKNVISSIEVEVKSDAPDSISISGNSLIDAGSYTNLSLSVVGGVNKNVKWTTSNSEILTVYKGIVLGLQKGTAKVIATSVVDNSVYGELEITVNEVKKEEYTQEEIDYVNNIINKMTLSQKVGQMFFVGFSGTSMPSSLSSAIENYNFGNVIYMGANCNNPKTLAEMSNDIQNKMVSSNLVPAFISTDQEGGRVARLTNGGTHFISQMAVCATGDYNNGYLQGVAVAKELLSYGINMDYAPVLDVNNNPDNPVIGNRSYAENPVSVALYGNNVIKGFKENGLVACPKHFPGHGNTSVDSHYGLPKITSSLEELYQIELAPFISSIANGTDAIMTTHIIFSAIDEDYPATLSEKVLQGLLRNTLGYEGLIVTDGMGMAAIASHYGTPDVSSVLAVKAGVDILLYTGLSDPKTAHTTIVKAVNNNEITIDRINESVRRILLTKLKYGIIDNYLVTDIDRTTMLEEHAELNLTFAKESLTLVKGSFNGLDKNKKTLIISPTTSYSLGSGLDSNSLANYAANYLKNNGHTNVTYKTVSTNISSSDSTSILTSVSNYDQIIVAFSNVKTSSYSRSAQFVKDLCSKHSNVIVIALDTPYDILSYGSSVKNYICVYGYQKATVEAISMYLNGEFTATGVSPVEFN